MCGSQNTGGDVDEHAAAVGREWQRHDRLRRVRRDCEGLSLVQLHSNATGSVVQPGDGGGSVPRSVHRQERPGQRPPVCDSTHVPERSGRFNRCGSAQPAGLHGCDGAPSLPAPDDRLHQLTQMSRHPCPRCLAYSTHGMEQKAITVVERTCVSTGPS